MELARLYGSFYRFEKPLVAIYKVPHSSASQNASLKSLRYGDAENFSSPNDTIAIGAKPKTTGLLIKAFFLLAFEFHVSLDNLRQ